ncbi:MAG: NAD(P)-dependent oxidoreductase [Clostridiales bacterium]|nr:NAD(P)-dependent oxidoreductase [Clostridiales bacterium]
MISWTGSKKPIEKVGLVGCGRMGKCMLQSMLDGGFQVVAYDKFPAAAEGAKEMGAEVAATPAELARMSSVVIMSLPGPVQLQEVLFGEDGLRAGLNSDHVVVDTSTVDPDTTRKNAEGVEAAGAAYLDCPILGRPSATGKWMLPTGGNPDALERVKPVLLTFAGNAIPVGGHGAGNALKLLNQLMFSCINAISSEVMAICDHVGIDKQVFYDTVAGSSAATVSGLFREVGNSIVTDGYENPAFTVDLLIKDAKLGLQMAKDADAPSVIAGTVQLYNEIAHAEGLGMQDTSALYKVFSQHYEKLS